MAALNFSRRALPIWILGAGSCLFLCNGSWTNAAEPITIVTVGDSYINGNTIVRVEDRFSARLGAALRGDGRSVAFQNVGYTDTSLDALHWLQNSEGQELLASPTGHVLILEIAQNDCSRFTLDESRANLDQIVSALSAKHIPVLVVGTLPYHYCVNYRGEEYLLAFPAMFADLASKYGELLYPDFKDGIEGQDQLLSKDQDHPNKDGETIIVKRILPSVEALLDRLR